MTIEEAIKNLNTMVLAASEPEQYISIGSFEEVKETIKKAIKSLEAWEKVEADILGLDGYYDDAFWEGTYAVSKIIGKHLAEVKHED